ncbi:IncF plasmid conjugative transfer protein TraD [Escherichia coli]|nr:IncF plasmid conjugative transfer protein TraD [Escherichia coli]SQL57797.1 IncF plasmid conjugative transfer protein TraD [Escherichia coli]
MRCRGLIALLIWGQSVAAADLGTWGDLWPVKEPDMLTVIMQRLTALEQSGEMGRKMDAFKERVIRNSLRPPAVPGIGRTEKYGSRLFDPSVRLAADIRDNEGQVFARQGEVMNPLQYVPFNQTLYFINGDDPAQVAWMKRQTPPTLESKIILVQGSIPEMQKSLDSRVYFDQNGVLCQRLGIDQVPAPPPLFRRIGLAIGYWEPMALTDVTRSPGCMVNLGFSLPAFGKTAQGTAKKDEKQVNGAFYHVHWYKYPLTYWLNIITSLGCLEGGDLDIAYLSEIDPTWTDSSLTTILNPEAVIFANPIAQGACAADAIASAFNMPLDVLFWCAGSQGSMYPFNGWVSNESSPLQSSLLVSERMAFKLHRQGMIMETIGKNNAVCNEYPSPILPKERWRYQMVNMYPDSGQCHPFGRSVTRWETGKNPPNTKKNFGYLMWRKRNCVFL